MDFGSITLGQSSSTQTVLVTNIGGHPLSLTSIQLSGPNATDFLESDTCMASPQIQPNKSCSISVTFNPSAVGSSSAAILITDEAAGSPQQIALSGAAVPPPNPTPVVTLNPKLFNFVGNTVEAAEVVVTVTTNGAVAPFEIETLPGTARVATKGAPEQVKETFRTCVEPGASSVTSTALPPLLPISAAPPPRPFLQVKPRNSTCRSYLALASTGLLLR